MLMTKKQIDGTISEYLDYYAGWFDPKDPADKATVKRIRTAEDQIESHKVGDYHSIPFIDNATDDAISEIKGRSSEDLDDRAEDYADLAFAFYIKGHRDTASAYFIVATCLHFLDDVEHQRNPYYHDLKPCLWRDFHDIRTSEVNSPRYLKGNLSKAEYNVKTLIGTTDPKPVASAVDRLFIDFQIDKLPD